MGNLSPGQDAELLKHMAAGSETAFVELFRRHRDGVYRLAYQMCGSRPAAEDITQEVFMVLIAKPLDFDSGRGQFVAYLYGVTRKHCLKHAERVRKSPPASCVVEARTEWADEASADDDPETRVAESQRHAAVRTAIRALPVCYRETLILCELHELSYEQAAAVLGCALGTVRSRLHRARLLLAQALRDPSSVTLPGELRGVSI
jgi:RNA polymerase sigma-70 factor (ECF subfamily)